MAQHADLEGPAEDKHFSAGNSESNLDIAANVCIIQSCFQNNIAVNQSQSRSKPHICDV